MKGWIILYLSKKELTNGICADFEPAWHETHAKPVVDYEENISN